MRVDQNSKAERLLKRMEEECPECNTPEDIIHWAASYVPELTITYKEVYAYYVMVKSSAHKTEAIRRTAYKFGINERHIWRIVQHFTRPGLKDPANFKG